MNIDTALFYLQELWLPISAIAYSMIVIFFFIRAYKKFDRD